MRKIIYPEPLQQGDTIAITAPSSGLESDLHHLLTRSKANLEKLGFTIVEGETIWTNDKCVSTSKEARVRELESYLLDDRVKAIIPPWGGEFLMELLPLINWEGLKNQQPNWIVGYSDISTLLFAYTLLTGYATAHGPGYVDIGPDKVDDTTVKWLEVLRTQQGQRVTQTSSSQYRSSWGNGQDTPTRWEILGDRISEQFSGRLIGGCMDTISILIGTEFAPVEQFSEDYCQDSGMIWYLESCEMNAADIYRHLWQMRQCGWFNNTNGVLIGRAAGYSPCKNFELTDALQKIFVPLNIPVLYNVDIGHVPPQMTLINGAFAEVVCSDGKGEITMTFS
ncbi:S66 peptidase family protein [Cohnella sp. WQ 127256]|uniref:S66 family peptidase n=1 Tax=Cohnella sp. WQ 127256 TaxID=2938790 RepID=UPI00211827A5|nr:S66 peptidase family protein [Cohnella sp. WQ 127256]